LNIRRACGHTPDDEAISDEGFHGPRAFWLNCLNG